MYRLFNPLIILAAMVLSLAACSNDSAMKSTSFAGMTYATPASLDEFEQITKASSKNKKIMMVFFYANEERWSKAFVRDTLSNPKVQEKLKTFTLVKVDISKTYSAAGAIKSKLGVLGPPTTVFIYPDGTISRWVYVKTEEFLSILDSEIIGK